MGFYNQYLCVIISFVLVPWVLGSKLQMFSDVRWLEFVIDIFFLIDMIFNCFTAYTSDIRMVTELKKITIHYLTTYFIIDFLASFPGFVTVESFKEIYFLKLLRFFNLGRFFEQVRFVLEKLKSLMRSLDRKTVENIMTVIQ